MGTKTFSGCLKTVKAQQLANNSGSLKIRPSFFQRNTLEFVCNNIGQHFPMIKSLFTLLLVSIGLTACDGTPKPNTANPSAAASVSGSLNDGNPYQDKTLTFAAQDVAPNQLDYIAASAPTTFYYTPQGEPSSTQVENGYYRQILGKTSDGRSVAQDFYQATQKPQTSPFILMVNASEQSFDKSVLDSRVIWYDGQGEITSVGEFSNGVQQGWLNVYEFNQLIMQLRDNDKGIDIRYFVPSEQLWGEARLQENLNTGAVSLANLTFYHGNGKVLSEVKVDESGKPTGVNTYDTNGQRVDAKQNATLNETMLRRFAVLMGKLPQLMAR